MDVALGSRRVGFISVLKRTSMSSCFTTCAFTVPVICWWVLGLASQVFKRIDHFWECGTCHHVYWEGPKFFEAREMFESLCDAQGALRRRSDNEEEKKGSSSTITTAEPSMVPAPLIMEAISELRHEQQAGRRGSESNP